MRWGFVLGLVVAWIGTERLAGADTDAEIAERARRIHASAFVFDGHNDLPWSLRKEGDVNFETLDLAKQLPKGQTDIPRMREGGLKAQFWSVFIPNEHENPGRTVIEQIDIVHRMVDRYPNDMELALDAADVERIVKAGKIASLIGIEGGIAIEEDLAMLRAFHRLGARYMTLTHNTTLDWADSAVDLPKSHGLSPFGERVVLEMNRLGMLVDISHVSAETMEDVLRIAKAPVIASHSSAFAVAPSPRNVPDEILKQLPKNGGVVMVNFYSAFVVPEAARAMSKARAEAREKNADPEKAKKAFEAWYKAYKMPRGTIKDVADHIDHIVKVAGIDHVGIGSDFDGITSWPVGLEDVSCYPKLTEELIRRGYSDADIAKILGGNALRAFRVAGDVAKTLQTTLKPAVDQPIEKNSDD
ncbi:dipeptidase [Singulisphaera sp. PoT]|uniref:dipeptidase n=1 Tax=Singulisphaera sp. PoT TaxID=3411797 RepID=UPI003BF596DA